PPTIPTLVVSACLVTQTPVNVVSRCSCLSQCLTQQVACATEFSLCENYSGSVTGCNALASPRDAAMSTGTTAERCSKSSGITTEIAAIATRFRPVGLSNTGTAAPVVPSSIKPSSMANPSRRILAKVVVMSPVGYRVFAALGCTAKYWSTTWAG